eukprot:s1005_g41.t1
MGERRSSYSSAALLETIQEIAAELKSRATAEQGSTRKTSYSGGSSAPVAAPTGGLGASGLQRPWSCGFECRWCQAPCARKEGETFEDTDGFEFDEDFYEQGGIPGSGESVLCVHAEPHVEDDAEVADDEMDQADAHKHVPAGLALWTKAWSPVVLVQVPFHTLGRQRQTLWFRMRFD